MEKKSFFKSIRSLSKETHEGREITETDEPGQSTKHCRYLCVGKRGHSSGFRDTRGLIVKWDPFYKELVI